MEKNSEHSERAPALAAAPLRVFLAEDNPEVRRMLATVFRRDGHFVLEAKDGDALLSHLGHAFRGCPEDDVASVVVTDVRMPGHDGLSILRALRPQPWCPPFIFITAFADRALFDEAQRLGAHAVFPKPFDLQVVRAKVASYRRVPAGPWLVGQSA
jgi:CheY-like chemotaxis protein